MIWRPAPGQRVELRYRRALREACPHEEAGVVVVVGDGPGPINAEVLLDDGRRVIVPRGHLFSSGSSQLTLFRGYYRCQSCGETVDHLISVKRFRICRRCHDEYVPEDGAGRDEVEAFWRWHEEMERRLPARRRSSRNNTGFPLSELNFCPACECGRLIEPLEVLPPGVHRSLWGGPFRWICEHCEIENEVRHLVGSDLRGVIRPDWDDEDWLDYLFESTPRAFELGILPDLWFKLSRQEVERAET